MSNDRLAELEQRLALAEREVARTCAQVRALQAQARPASRPWGHRVPGLLGIVLVLALTTVPTTRAQGEKGLQVLTVKAPFKVMDASGTKTLLHLNDFGNGVVALTIGTDTGTLGTGAVQIGVPPGGSGVISIYDKAGKMSVGIGTVSSENVVTVLGPGESKWRGRLSVGAQKANLSLLGAGGALALTSGDKAPSMDITNPAGNVLVSAYVTKSGLGAVAVGPAGDGVAGTLTGGKAASAILGKH